MATIMVHTASKASSKVVKIGADFNTAQQRMFRNIHYLVFCLTVSNCVSPKGPVAQEDISRCHVLACGIGWGAGLV